MNKETSATKEELAAIQKRLSETHNDPDLMMLECHCISFDLKLKTPEQKEANCKKCPVRIDFIKRHPNNIYKEEQ